MTPERTDGTMVRLASASRVRAAVPNMIGYRMPPIPGVHRGLPSPYLALVFSLSGDLPIDVPVGPGVRSGSFGIPVGGLHTRPVLLPWLPTHHGRPAPQRGIQLAVHPFASRALFGMPASELTREVIELEDVVGGDVERLREGLLAQPDAGSAFDLVTDWLVRRVEMDRTHRQARELHRAWEIIVGSAGQWRISDVAREVGWSRRHLTAQLRAETGLGAKDLARVSRFQRSRQLIMSRRTVLADVAAVCGYTDQSHLTTEWREFAACTPTQWMAAEMPALTHGAIDPISPRQADGSRAS